MPLDFSNLPEPGSGQRATGMWHLAFPHLRDYQMQCINDLVKRWDAGATRVPMVLATGLGKTEIFTPLEALWVAGNEYTERALHEVYGLGKRVLVLAHTDELIEQAARKARLRNPSLTVGIVKADRNEVHAQIVVSSRQTLASAKRREAIRNVGLLIIDECHHALRTNTYGKILEHFGAFRIAWKCSDSCTEGECPRHAEPRCKVAGFTATLARGDKGKLSTVWEEVTFRRDILFGIRRGYLLDVRAERIIIPDLDLGNVQTRGGDFTDSSLADELERRHAPENVAEQYKARAGGRKGIAFWPLVETAYSGAAAFEAQGIPSAVVHGGLPKTERRQILADFHTGKIQVVHNCMVLTEGFDEPTADVCVVARPTKSAPLYQQMVGRVLRPDLTLPTEQREKALILDVTGAGAINDLRSLIDLSPERVPNLDEDDERSLLELDELYEEQQNEGAGFDIEPEQYRGETRIEEFDPLHRERLWAQTPDGTFYMSAGSEQYVFLFEHEPNEWDVIWTNKKGAQKAGMTEYVSLSLEDALMFAEDEAIERGGHGTKSLTSRKSKWRSEPPTAPQEGLARARGIWRDGMSKGECSEALDAWTAERRIDPLVKKVKARMS